MTAESATLESASLVLYEVDEGVALLTWNRPERNNAWTPAMETEYFDALRRAESDPDVRVIVVTGAGRNFCPGMDTQLLSKSSNGSRENDPEGREPQTLPSTILKPIIAAISGACAGTGFIQACMVDLRFVDADARVTAAFPRRGIMAEHGLSVLLPALVGQANASDILLSGRVFSGRESSEFGFGAVSEPGGALDDALRYARDMATHNSPQAMAVTKLQLWRNVREPLEQARLRALHVWRTLRLHTDFKEGVASFSERRPPQFAPLGQDELLEIKRVWEETENMQ